MCAPGVCRETQVLESPYRKKKYINLILWKWSLSSIVISYLLVIQEFGLKNLHCNNAIFFSSQILRTIVETHLQHSTSL